MRKYASFFENFNKEQKEIGVVEELIDVLNQAGEGPFTSPQLCELDPPDCVCINRSGEMVAIEVTEVLCEEAVKANAQGKEVFRVWHPGDLVEIISNRLTEKDSKTFHGGPYSEKIICLFTDEPALILEEAESEIGAYRFGPFSQITSVYLVFSYNAELQSYPVLKLITKNIF